MIFSTIFCNNYIDVCAENEIVKGKLFSIEIGRLHEIRFIKESTKINFSFADEGIIFHFQRDNQLFVQFHFPRYVQIIPNRAARAFFRQFPLITDTKLPISPENLRTEKAHLLRNCFPKITLCVMEAVIL